MFQGRKVNYVVSDLHLGAGDGLDLSLYQPIGRDFRDQSIARKMGGIDLQLWRLIRRIVAMHRGGAACLTLLGDTFDHHTAAGSDLRAIVPTEDDCVRAFQRIVDAHPGFILALRYFCRQPGFTLRVFLGNHDIFLKMPKVWEEFLRLVSPDHPERVERLASLDEDGVHYEHGAVEPHDRFDPDKIVIEREGLPPLLNVTLGHLLTVSLMNPLRLVNFLLARMYKNFLIWIDAFMHIGRRSFYRSRSFPFVAIYHTVKTLLGHSVIGIKKTLQVIWWTIVGTKEGFNPRDYAIRFLETHEDTHTVILGHEHWAVDEPVKVANRLKRYINTGTWVEMLETRGLSEGEVWKRFRRLQRLLHFVWNLFRDADLVPIRILPVTVVTYYDDGRPSSVQLLRWHPKSQEIGGSGLM